MRATILGAISVVVLGVTLSLGLWPFHSPRNDVTWLRDRNGLHFGRNSTAIASRAFGTTSEESEAAVTFEIWLRPDRIWDRNTCLAFSLPRNSVPFALRQSEFDLALKTETARLFVEKAFRRAAPSFITLTSSAQGTIVYIDGVPVRTAPQFRLRSKDLAGRLVLGDSPGQGDSWSGQFYGLAIYRMELAAPQVWKHYESWVRNGRPDIGADERNAVLLLFEERTGKVVHDRSGSGVELYIPDRYMVLDKIFLEPLWKEFDMSHSYWGAALKNVVGFVPFGFFVYAYLSAAFRIKRPAHVTVVLGLIVSLTIEILQAYLPTRDSGTTDLITNTLGTYLGVLTYNPFASILVRMFPWLAHVVPPNRSSPETASEVTGTPARS